MSREQQKSREPDSHMSMLSKQALEDSDRWFGDSGTTRNIAYMTLALCGEVGELANIIKKIERGSLDVKSADVRYQMMMEATDAQTYLLIIYGLMGVDPEKALMHVRGLNEKRFMAERAKREANNG